MVVTGMGNMMDVGLPVADMHAGKNISVVIVFEH